MHDPEQMKLVEEITSEIPKLGKDDLWKLHKALNEIKYTANMTKYRKRGLLLTPIDRLVDDSYDKTSAHRELTGAARG